MMTDPQPNTDLVRAVRAGCAIMFPDCSFPSESCNRYCANYVAQIRAALAELETLSEEMLAAAEPAMKEVNDRLGFVQLRGSAPISHPDGKPPLWHAFRAIMRRVLGQAP